MRFSEEEVNLIGVGLSLIVSILIWIPIGRMNIKWCVTHPQVAGTKSQIWSLIFGTVVLCILWRFVCKPIFHFDSAIILLSVGSLTVTGMLIPYYRNCIRKARQLCDDADSIKPRVLLVNQMWITLWMNFALGLAGVTFILWLMPDVAVIEKGMKGGLYDYKTEKYYALPFCHGRMPGRSYVDNLTSDTIYRVTVDYGFLGEEVYNYYGITETYAPHAFSRMRSRADHVMDTIAPIMLPSYGRRGKYRTQRIYLTDKGHLEDFGKADLRHLGIKENRRVDSIREYTNRSIRENPIYYRAYKTVDPSPYPRLRNKRREQE